MLDFYFKRTQIKKREMRKINDKVFFRIALTISIVVFILVVLLNRRLLNPPAEFPDFIYHLPKLHATINGICSILLLLSLRAIRSGKIQLHKKLNITTLKIRSTAIGRNYYPWMRQSFWLKFQSLISRFMIIQGLSSSSSSMNSQWSPIKLRFSNHFTAFSLIFSTKLIPGTVWPLKPIWSNTVHSLKVSSRV